jgi:serine/threonine protein kinase
VCSLFFRFFLRRVGQVLQRYPCTVNCLPLLFFVRATFFFSLNTVEVLAPSIIVSALLPSTMSSVFSDTRGNTFRIESLLGGESDSYASLFTTAVTYRARHITASLDTAATACVAGANAPPLTPGQPHPTASASVPHVKPNTISKTVMVTYIPLLSSVQGIAPSKEASALLVLQDHIRLRRQIEHPLLRSLFDVFYTQQCLAAPGRSGAVTAPTAGAAAVGTPVEVTSPTNANARVRKAACLPSSVEDVNGDESEVKDDEATDGSKAAKSSPPPSNTTSKCSDITGAALVIVEEFVEGCSLADYADAIARRRLVPTSAKLQRDAAAIAYQLAQLFHYLHGTGYVLCRDMPFENVMLDQNKGFISVRLPLSALRMLQEPGEKCLTNVAAALMSQTSQLNRVNECRLTEKSCSLRAPELRSIPYWDAAWNSSDGTSDGGAAASAFGAADIWTLGVVTTLLCTLNHKQFAQTTRAERFGIASAQVQRLQELLPGDMEEGMQDLIRGCLEASPTARPTAGGVLKSAVFVTYRSNTELEQHRAVISIAEAVENANKRKMPPPPLQLAESSTTAATRTVAVVPDTDLSLLSLHDTAWEAPKMYRDVFLSNGGDGAAALPGEPTTSRSSQVLNRVSPSLARASQYALQDLMRLCAQYTRLNPTDASDSAPSSAYAGAMDRKGNTVCERVRRSRQMPRDLPSTIRTFEELTARFSQLERINPDVSFRLMELLLEGFSSSPQDVASIRKSVTLADALLYAEWPPATLDEGAAVAGRVGSLETSVLSASVDKDQRDFQVADVLRSMPTMPERMIASDRAANTSAVLYNQWLKKEKKKFAKLDGY